MNHEPTDKQKWAVELILSNNPTLDKPDFSFEAYRAFISDHSEEYTRAKEVEKKRRVSIRSFCKEKDRQYKWQHSYQGHSNIWETDDYGDVDDFWGGEHLYY